VEWRQDSNLRTRLRRGGSVRFARGHLVWLTVVRVFTRRTRSLLVRAVVGAIVGGRSGAPIRALPRRRPRRVRRRDGIRMSSSRGVHSALLLAGLMLAAIGGAMLPESRRARTPCGPRLASGAGRAGHDLCEPALTSSDEIFGNSSVQGSRLRRVHRLPPRTGTHPHPTQEPWPEPGTGTGVRLAEVRTPLPHGDRNTAGPGPRGRGRPAGVQLHPSARSAASTGRSRSITTPQPRPRSGTPNLQPQVPEPGS
jgi:hypothetical protein